MPDKIVALDLLTDDDLSRLGHNFARHYPVPRDAAFYDLLQQLNKLPPVPRRFETGQADD